MKTIAIRFHVLSSNEDDVASFIKDYENVATHVNTGLMRTKYEVHNFVIDNEEEFMSQFVQDGHQYHAEVA